MEKVSRLAILVQIVTLSTCAVPVAMAQPSVPSANSIQPISMPESKIQSLERKWNQSDSKPEQIELKATEAHELIPLSSTLDVFRQESFSNDTVSLRECLSLGLDNNLPIQIANSQAQIEKWRLGAAMGRFLPDITTGYSDTWQKGHLSINGKLVLDLHNPYIYSSSAIRYYAFRGGAVFYGALQQRNLLKAARAALGTNINDVTLLVSHRYNELLLREALLQIQIKAVQTSQIQLEHNVELKKNGAITKLELLQARAQLARDRQEQIDAEFELRKASIDLSNTLNLRGATNLTVRDRRVLKSRLINQNMTIMDLIDTGLSNRPELKQLEQERLAAQKTIHIALAPLLPKFSISGGIIGSGATAGQSYQTANPSYASVAVSGQGSTQTVLGNTAGALPNVITAYPLASTGSQTVYPSGVVALPAQKVSERISSLGTLGWLLEWNLPGMGIPDAANIGAAKVEARRAMLKLNKSVLDVVDEIRISYLRTFSAERRIEESSEEVEAAEEELRVAQERIDNGLGTNLDVITAQRDSTQALIKKARAIIEFNNAELQLLRDIGAISVDTICSGKLYGKSSSTQPATPASR